MDERAVSVDWKRNNITPVFKLGTEKYPSNYRLVSLTIKVVKVMKKVDKKRDGRKKGEKKLLVYIQHDYYSLYSSSPEMDEV